MIHDACTQLQIGSNPHVLQHCQKTLKTIILRDIARHFPETVKVSYATVQVDGSGDVGDPVAGENVKES